MNITLKDVPSDLHQRLQIAASESGRSLNKLILHALRGSFVHARLLKPNYLSGFAAADPAWEYGLMMKA